MENNYFSTYYATSTVKLTCHTLVFLFTFLFAAPPSFAGKVYPSEDPHQLIQDIYGRYPSTQPNDTWHKADGQRIPNFENLPFSRHMQNLIELSQRVHFKDNEYPGCLDYDPISDSQDPDVALYNISGSTRIDSNSLKIGIGIRGKYPNSQKKISYFLKNEGGEWRVDDIVNYNAGKPISVKMLYKECVDQHKK